MYSKKYMKLLLELLSGLHISLLKISISHFDGQYSDPAAVLKIFTTMFDSFHFLLILRPIQNVVRSIRTSEIL